MFENEDGGKSPSYSYHHSESIMLNKKGKNGKANMGRIEDD